MTLQLLPDDILLLILEEHLTVATGYNHAERTQAIRSVSLASRTLAIACRRFIFERTKISIGSFLDKPVVESAAEGLKQLFELNPSYFGFVKSLRIESTLECHLVEAFAGIDVTTQHLGKDNHNLSCPHEPNNRNLVSIHYTSTILEEAAVCWLLAQHFPNLKSFHFIVRPATSGEQPTLRKAAFSGILPALTLTADVNLPKAVLQFLHRAGKDSLEHLTLSSNLPPQILRYFNQSRPLKSLALTKFSDVKPVINKQTEIPFFVDINEKADGITAFPISGSIGIEDLDCDMSGGNLNHWLYGPQSSVDWKGLKSLHLRPANEGRPFPFGLCSETLTDLSIVYSNRLTPSVSLGVLGALRRLSIRVDAEWSLDQVAFSLNTLQSQNLEHLEVALRLTHVMDFKIIQLLTSLDRRLFSHTHNLEKLKKLSIVGYMSDDEWEKVEARKGFEGFKNCLMSVFHPLFKSPNSAHSLLDVTIVRDTKLQRGQ